METAVGRVSVVSVAVAAAAGGSLLTVLVLKLLKERRLLHKLAQTERTLERIAAALELMARHQEQSHQQQQQQSHHHHAHHHHQQHHQHEQAHENDDDDVYEEALEEFDQTQSFFQEIDELRTNDQTMQARQQLLRGVENQPETVESLWRLARSAFDESQVNTARKEALLREGQEIADRALQMDPQCAEAHKWYGVCCGALSEFGGPKEKLTCGMLFRKHVENAIAINPNDPVSYHLLARWCFEVAQLTWIQKRACAALIGAPPESTFQEALDLFLKAEQIQPGFWISNQLMIGKTYAKMSEPTEARLYLRKCLDMPARTEEDRKSQEEARSLL